MDPCLLRGAPAARAGGEHKVPEWDFPGNLTVERMLRRAERFTDIAEQVVTHLPKSKAMRDAVRRTSIATKARVDFVKRYSDLYGMYTETEVVYTDDRTLGLFESLSAEDKAMFPFDAAMVDWKYYLQDVHSPAVTQSLRELSKRDRERYGDDPGAWWSPWRCSTWRARSSRRTWSKTTCGHAWPTSPPRSGLAGSRACSDASRLPADRSARSRRLPAYVLPAVRGASVEGIDRLVADHVAEFMLQKASAAAIRRIREHRAAGHRDPDHGRRRGIRAPALAAVRRGDRRRARGT